MSYFKWFDLPEDHNLDLNKLQEKYYALSKKMHPDNFQGKSALEHQLAQQALQLNHQAYQTLFCPIKRLSYILLLNKIDLASEEMQKQPFSADFLEKIFEWQSNLNDKSTKVELENTVSEKLAQAIDLLKQSNYESVVPLAREILFMNKIMEHS